jgi:hypothetical protein
LIGIFFLEGQMPDGAELHLKKLLAMRCPITFDLGHRMRLALVNPNIEFSPDACLVSLLQKSAQGRARAIPFEVKEPRIGFS